MQKKRKNAHDSLGAKKFETSFGKLYDAIQKRGLSLNNKSLKFCLLWFFFSIFTDFDLKFLIFLISIVFLQEDMIFN